MGGAPFPELKLSGREGKYIFKSALQPHVPDGALYRPKQGFAVPLAAWFRGPLRQRMRDTVLGPTLRATQLFDMGYIEQLVERHVAGAYDHSAVLWTLSMFEAFLQNSHERPRPARQAARWELAGVQPGAAS